MSEAQIRKIDGQMVLIDDAAVGMVLAVEEHNRKLAKQACLRTLSLNRDRVHHFEDRRKTKNLEVDDVVIVIVNVDAQFGAPLASKLMPGHNWQTYRDQGKVPFARGLASRAGILDILGVIDAEAAAQLCALSGRPAVVVVDHGVAVAVELPPA